MSRRKKNKCDMNSTNNCIDVTDDLSQEKILDCSVFLYEPEKEREKES